MSANNTAEYVTFDVDGDWVTKTAREWLYADRRPYEKVLDFLLSAMAGTDNSEETLIRYANDILEGKRKLAGSTRDGSYGLESDNANIIREYHYYFQNRPEEKYIVVGREEDDESTPDTTDKITALVERVERQAALLGGSAELDDYGWLRPDGKFFAVGWGDHEKFAMGYVKKYFPRGDLVVDAGGFLTEKGWILLHRPSGGKVSPWSLDYSSATKRQKEFLYGYFLAREGSLVASMVWEEKE
jgi:hypothetical protein